MPVAVKKDVESINLKKKLISVGKPLKSIKVQVTKKPPITWWIAYQSARPNYNGKAFLVKSKKVGYTSS